ARRSFDASRDLTRKVARPRSHDRRPLVDYTYREIAKMIDHSLLQPALTLAELEAGCALARELDVASVCILPYAVPLCAEVLRGSDVEASTTVGVPHGGHTMAVKLAEAERALADGAEELDMVVNLSKVRSSDFAYVEDEIQRIVSLAHAAHGKVKVIFEN